MLVVGARELGVRAKGVVSREFGTLESCFFAFAGKRQTWLTSKARLQS